MSDFFLNLADRTRVMDFLAGNVTYAPDRDRIPAEKAFHTLEEGERLPKEKLAEAARRLAIATWPARYAIGRFFETEGREEEWRRVLAAVRPSTAHMLKRFRSETNLSGLDEVLAHEDSNVAFHDEERFEISEVRVHVRQEYWKERADTLTVLAEAGQKELKGYLGRFTQLRDLASSLPPNLQDEVFSKLAHYEDRIFFEGRVVAMEVLDEEIKYYREQKELGVEE